LFFYKTRIFDKANCYPPETYRFGTGGCSPEAGSAMFYKRKFSLRG